MFSSLWNFAVSWSSLNLTLSLGGLSGEAFSKAAALSFGVPNTGAALGAISLVSGVFVWSFKIAEGPVSGNPSGVGRIGLAELISFSLINPSSFQRII